MNIDVRALAQLAKLEVEHDELGKLEEELPGILAFVETIQKAPIAKETKGEGLRNIMREDTDPHESGIYTERLLAAAPNRRENRIAVKQVVSRKK